MEKLFNFFQSNFSEALVTFVIIGVTYLLKVIIIGIFERRFKAIRKRYLFRQTISYSAYIIIVLSVILIWFEWLTNFLTFLSLVTGAIIIASKEIIQNFFANFVIISRELFQVGDRIQIGNTIGDVLETGPFYVTLAEIGSGTHTEEPTGRVVKVPNNFVFTTSLANYSKTLSVIWNEVSITVGYKTDIKEIKKIIADALAIYAFNFDEKTIEEIRHKHGDLLFPKTESAIYIIPEEKKFKVIIRYACKFFKRRESENHILEYLLENFQGNDKIDYFEVKAADPTE